MRRLGIFGLVLALSATNAHAQTNAAGDDVRVVGFGQFGHGRFNADQSFDAVFGSHGGFWLGGGGELRWKRWFGRVTLERFSRTGERVFVLGDQIFPLGVSDTLTLTPLVIAGGYRHDRWTLTPYVGAGVGRYAIREESEFAAESENVSRGARSYVIIGGIDRRVTRLVAAGFEFQFAHVPGAFTGGVADLFGERSLSGTQLRVRVVVGR